MASKWNLQKNVPAPCSSKIEIERYRNTKSKSNNKKTRLLFFYFPWKKRDKVNCTLKTRPDVLAQNLFKKFSEVPTTFEMRDEPTGLPLLLLREYNTHTRVQDDLFLLKNPLKGNNWSNKRGEVKMLQSSSYSRKKKSIWSKEEGIKIVVQQLDTVS